MKYLFYYPYGFAPGGVVGAIWQVNILSLSPQDSSIERQFHFMISIPFETDINMWILQRCGSEYYIFVIRFRLTHKIINAYHQPMLYQSNNLSSLKALN